MRRNLYDVDHESLRDSVRNFLDREFTPSWDRCSEAQQVPRERDRRSTPRLLRVARGVTGRHILRCVLLGRGETRPSGERSSAGLGMTPIGDPAFMSAEVSRRSVQYASWHLRDAAQLSPAVHS